MKRILYLKNNFSINGLRNDKKIDNLITKSGQILTYAGNRL